MGQPLESDHLCHEARMQSYVDFLHITAFYVFVPFIVAQFLCSYSVNCHVICSEFESEAQISPHRWYEIGVGSVPPVLEVNHMMSVRHRTVLPRWKGLLLCRRF